MPFNFSGKDARNTNAAEYTIEVIVTDSSASTLKRNLRTSAIKLHKSVNGFLSAMNEVFRFCEETPNNLKY